jgi:hypothetical protein
MHRRPLVVTLLAAALILAFASAVLAAPPRNFVAPLSGDQEAVPVDTDARGVAHFQLRRDGTALDYRLNVANIHDVTMAHIHLDASNGPVVAWLYPVGGGGPETKEGRVSGTLATGTLTADDLVNALAGHDLDALIEEIVAGNAYVNVHTLANPGGEIAGAINRPRGHTGG